MSMNSSPVSSPNILSGTALPYSDQVHLATQVMINRQWPGVQMHPHSLTLNDYFIFSKLLIPPG